MQVADFDYHLPEERIAKYPPLERGSTRLLVLNRQSGALTHSLYAHLDTFLQAGDLLLLNNTRVVPARLFAIRATGATIELMLLERHHHREQLVLYRGKLKAGEMLQSHGHTLLVEEVLPQGLARLALADGGDLHHFFTQFGSVPIPPYLKRNAEAVDRERYQTVFAAHSGSVAAPTASLNMTPELLRRLKNNGVEIAHITLHVGLGTFLPIRTESLEEHVMHRESYLLPAESIAALQRVKADGGRVVAVGTTVTRALEHAAPRILQSSAHAEIEGEADIFIYPGYRFQMVDLLLTNFHAPRSTVLMLTAACAGTDNLRAAYSEAVLQGYNFLSYGDSMLIC